jgi:hypothetical protein
MNYWYAVTYAYGEHRINHGSTPNILARFRERSERDRYVNSSTVDSKTDPGYTEAINSRHPYVRRYRHDTLWQPINGCRGEYLGVFDA